MWRKIKSNLGLIAGGVIATLIFIVTGLLWLVYKIAKLPKTVVNNTIKKSKTKGKGNSPEIRIDSLVEDTEPKKNKPFIKRLFKRDENKPKRIRNNKRK